MPTGCVVARDGDSLPPVPRESLLGGREPAESKQRRLGATAAKERDGSDTTAQELSPRPGLEWPAAWFCKICPWHQPRTEYKGTVCTVHSMGGCSSRCKTAAGGRCFGPREFRGEVVCRQKWEDGVASGGRNAETHWGVSGKIPGVDALENGLGQGFGWVQAITQMVPEEPGWPTRWPACGESRTRCRQRLAGRERCGGCGAPSQRTRWMDVPCNRSKGQRRCLLDLSCASLSNSMPQAIGGKSGWHFWESPSSLLLQPATTREWTDNSPFPDAQATMRNCACVPSIQSSGR